MTKNIIIILSLLVLSSCQESNNIHGTNETGIVHPKNHNFEYVPNKLEKVSLSLDYTLLESTLKEFKNSGDSIRYNWRAIQNREIISGFHEEIIILNEDIKTIGIGTRRFEMFMQNTHIINLIKYKSQIAFIEIFNDRNHKPFLGKSLDAERLYRNQDAKLIAELKEKYAKVYNGDLEIKKLFNSKIAYGINCEVVHLTQKYRNEIDLAVTFNDQKTLRKLFQNSNLEIKLFAIDGYLQLISKNKRVDNQTLEAIKEVENLDGKALFCEGHTVSYKSLKYILHKLRKEYAEN